MSTLSLTFDVKDEGNGLKKIVTDANALRNSIKRTIPDAHKLGEKMMGYASAAVVLRSISDAMRQLNSVVQDLTAAYSAQVQVETQLATVMRERMNATDKDIQSIKDLCAAQQELGVIGDEVQLAGAQQLATFVTQRQTLEKLIPVMNNMVAQQAGLNASASDATSAATVLGKAMSGNDKALKRMGISLTDSQKKLLELGTESQRAAVLVKVITDKYGEMNAELAGTDAGKAKQLANTMEDLKEKLGGMVQGVAPIISVTANIVIAAAGAAKLATAFKAVFVAVKSLKVVHLAYNAVLAKFTVNSVAASGAASMLGRKYAALPPVLRNIATAYKTATVAGKAFMAATGIGIAALAITSIVSLFTDAVDDMTDATEQLTLAERNAKRAAEELAEAEKQGAEAGASAKLQIAEHIKKINEFNGTKSEEKKLLKELRSTYSGVMGDFKTLSDWYNALTKNSETYCRQMILEAKIAHYKNKIVAGEAEYTELTGKEFERNVSAQNATDEYNSRKAHLDQQGEVAKAQVGNVMSSMGGGLVAWFMKGKIDRDVERLKTDMLAPTADVVTLANSIDASYAAMDKAVQEVSEMEMPVMGSSTPYPEGGGGHSSLDKEKTLLQQINELIEVKKQAYLTASDTDRATIQKEIADLSDEKKAIELLQSAAERPIELNSLADYDAEIAFQQKLLQEADGEMIKAVQDEIDRLQKARAAFASKAHEPMAVDQIKTYEELDREISYYTDKLKTATETERTEIKKKINALNELKDTWDEVLNALEKPADVSQLHTIKDLQKAVQYYRTLQQKASADEYTDLQRTINALEAKIAAQERGARMLEIQRQIGALTSLPDQEMSIEIQAIGLEGIESMVKELQAMLSDLANPLTEAQRGMVEGLIDSLNELKKNKAFGGLTKEAKTAWEGVNALGSAFSSLGSTIEVPAIDIMGTLAQAIATMVLSYSEALFMASILGPIGWMAFAATGLAQLTAVIASVKSVAKFADGGIAYGPTLGLFGEYAGASSNPEVVAPLNKLKQLIEPRDAAVVAGHVEFEIDGRRLVGVLRKVNALSARS